MINSKKVVQFSPFFFMKLVMVLEFAASFIHKIIVIGEEIDSNKLYEPPTLSLLDGLCRGKDQISPYAQSKMHCYFKRDKPFLLLAPHKVELLLRDPMVLIFRNVLSATEISTIKTLASKKLRRAQVIDPQTGKTEQASYRISKSAWLNDEEHPVIGQINKRIHDMTNLALASAEQLQVANYGTGGHYAPHFDYFRANEVDPHTLELYGNRVATVLFYLTQPNKGGMTIFTELRLSVTPSERDALFWYNLNSDGSTDARTRHAACPVLSGVKWVANKWLHERGQEFIRQCLAHQHEARRRLSDVKTNELAGLIGDELK